jgi:hypothetical protein
MNQPSLSGFFEGQNNFEVEPDMLNSYFKENPPEFQEGHLRINFAAPENRRVYANATIGRQRTRVYGRNAANLKRKYNSRKAGQNAAAANTRRIAENTARKARNAAAAAKEIANVARRAESQAKFTQQEKARLAQVRAATLKSNLEKAKKEAASAKERTAASAKTTKEAAEQERRARVTAGLEKPSIGNRMKGLFKRGGNKTRRANRRGTSRRRS